MRKVEFQQVYCFLITYPYTTGTLGTVQSTNTYTYGNAEWGDQLTGFNGTAITCDALGNPLSYYNGSSYAFTWQKGRTLATATKGGVTSTYTYNADGIRTKKTVGSTTTEYVLNGSQILAEKRGDTVIRYLYDENGLPIGMIFNGTTYLYEKNLQGDVIGIYTTDGTKVAWYYYDAWGKSIKSSYASGYSAICSGNPFRYRGYYYDTETGFYYLQSRYYDPTTGRFLNADGYLSTGTGFVGYNMYAYCNNNPISRIDKNGELWGFVIKAAISVIVNVTISIIAKKATGQEYTWCDLGVAVASGIANAFHPALGAAVDGVGAMISAKFDGATWGEATAIGAVSAVTTFASISNLSAQFCSEGVTLATDVALDLSFGTGYSILTETFSLSVMTKKEKEVSSTTTKNE